MNFIKQRLVAVLFYYLALTSVQIFAQTDIYKKDVIRVSLKEQAGKMEGSRVLNDQLEIDVYVKDYSIDKAKKVCSFYKDFYAYRAKKRGNRFTIYVSVWSKKILASQIDNVSLQDKYYHGGINYNYYNGKYFEDIY